MHPRRLVYSLSLLGIVLAAGPAAASRRLYVAYLDSDKVGVFDYLNGSATSVGEVAVCNAPQAVAAVTVPSTSNPPGAPAPGPVFAACDGEVWQINPSLLTAAPLVNGGGTAIALAVHPDGTRLYVADLEIGSVSEVDVITGAVVHIASPAGSGRPLHLAMAPDGARLYVASTNGSLWWITTATRATEKAMLSAPGATLPVDIGGLHVTSTQAFLTGQDTSLLYSATLSSCSSSGCPLWSSNAFTAVPERLAYDPAPGLGGPWIAFPSQNKLRPWSNLAYSFSVTGPAGMAYDDDFYTLLTAASGGDRVRVFHFAAGPLPDITLPMGSGPVDLALGPEVHNLQASPGSARLQYKDYEIIEVAIVVRNRGLKILNTGADYVGGDGARVFTVTSDCGKRSLSPNATCKVRVVCKPPADGAPQRATYSLPSDSKYGLKQIGLVCAKLQVK